MTAHQGYRVSATTTGITSSPFEHLRVNYVYGGDKHDEAAEVTRPVNIPGSRAERLRRYAEAREAGKTRDEAAVIVGITAPTARDYERDYQAAKTAGQEGDGDA